MLKHISNAHASYAIACLLCLAATIGCSDGRPQRVPVAGQVLIDGEPVRYGFVQFFNDNNRAAIGKLDETGHFRLSCFTEFDGAVLGEHQVAIIASEQLNDTQKRWFAPKKYSDPAQSGLIQEITGPTDSLTIELTWSGGKPFVEGEPPPPREPKNANLPHYISQ